MKRWLLMIWLVPAVAGAVDESELRERIDQLEARIERLEQRLGVAVPELKREAVPEVVRGRKGEVVTRYWLTQKSPFDGEAGTPLREGEMSLSPLVTLDPTSYGVEGGGLFSVYRDPSRYPVAALQFESELQIEKPGPYRLVVKATPPREVGGAGNVAVGVNLSLAGKTVFSQEPSSSLAPREKKLELSAGRVPLHLEILARSPGFGPSPTGTKIFIGLQAPGAIDATPISDFLVPARTE